MKKAPKKVEKRVTVCSVCAELCEADKEVVCFVVSTGETMHMRCRDKTK